MQVEEKSQEKCNLCLSPVVKTQKQMKTSFFLFLFIAISILPAHGQVDKFDKPVKFTDLNTVYEYRKSNWDGTHASSVFLYVADSNKLESFKWWQGDEEATLVTARIDWKIFSVTRFENYKLRKGQSPQFIAKLSGQKKLDIEVMGVQDSLFITELPWHSYDFDFAGLSFIWRALKNKKEPFWFHIADVAMVNQQPKFVNKGRVGVTFKGYEKINNKNCLKYFANGIGLENKGGHIWVNSENYMIEQYKVELADEPGFQNGMMQLIKTFSLSSVEWERFKKQKLGE
jgi:hypothetical protein